MEKTLARAIYKKMAIGKEYTSYDLKRLLDDDYYRYISPEQYGKDVRKIIANEMWKVVNAGYATTAKKTEELCLCGGYRYGAKNLPTQTYTIRYWKRIK